MATITGTSGSNKLTGTSGNDEIQGLGGNDVIDGGGGNDYLDGGTGDDTVRGGAGDDLIDDFLGSGTIDGGDGADTIWIARETAGDTLVANGGNDNDSIYVYLAAANDLTVNGGQGSDFVTLTAQLGTLRLTLGSSRDILRLYGGLLNTEGQQMHRSGGTTVTDFTVGASGDVLDLDEFLAESLIGWNQSANPFGSGYLRLVKSGSNTLLQIDADASGTAHAFGTLLVLANVLPTSLIAANFGGYNPTGTAAKGVTINGTDDWDMLTGTLGDDSIYAKGGGGQLAGLGGADKLYGGSAADTLMGDLGHDLLDGSGGDDNLSGGYGNDKAYGGAGADTLFGEQGNDVLDGGDGDDYLHAGAGVDQLIGGEGNDQLYKSDRGSATMNGGNGNDLLSLWGYASGATLIGGAGDDLLLLSAGIYEGTYNIDAGSGADRIQFERADGTHRVKAGSGADVLAFTGSLYDLWSSGIVVLDFEAGPGGDRIEWGDLLKDGLVGWNKSSNPLLTGHVRLLQSGTSTLLQVDQDGDDFASGFITLVEFANVARNDITSENLGGYSPLPVKNGNASSNMIKGGVDAERINGLAGNDRLFGNGGNDQLVGDSGNDYLDGGSGSDAMFGGRGNDTYIVNSGSDRIFERSDGGLDRVESTASFTLSNHVENLYLKGTGAISGTGNDLANLIVGNGAANRLWGDDGDDVLDGGAGADTMRGGLGNDRYIVDSAADLVYEDNRAGTDTIETFVEYQLPVQVERLVLAGTGDLTGRGNSSDNWLYGNGGDNVLNGGRGNDRIEGGTGHDWIYGSHGKDVLVGGSGKDRFYFHTEAAPDNADRILDFSPRDDTIYLARYAFTDLAGSGKLSASAFRQGTRAGDSNDRIIYDQASGNLFYDADGSGAAAAVLFATVTPGTALSYADVVAYG